MEKERYKHLNKYLKEKFGERTLKICIDGHFTCPNRDGLCGKNGCIFCSEKGSGEHIARINGNADILHNLSHIDSAILDSTNSINKDFTHITTNSVYINQICNSISSQVKNYFQSYKSERANKFIAYFQNFTNTYDTIENLKLKYDSALIDSRIVGLEIATRPDCINEEIVKLLSSYKNNYYICIELGLQTSNDITGNLINRGYNAKDFERAVNLLNKYNIDVVSHIMVGLPNETIADIINTTNFINQFNIQGIKIHSTYVIKNTKLENMYLFNKYKTISLEYYLNCLEYIITHINSNIVIHRLSGDAPKEMLVAPDWNSHKKWVLNGIDKILREKNLWQGCKLT